MEELDSHFSSEFERIGRAAAPQLAELQALSREITAFGAKLDLKFDYDYVAEANALYGELVKHYVSRSDAAVVRATLALSHKRLTELKQEYAEDVALYWEAVAAIAEADIAVIATRSGSGELLVRLGDLKERLFAPGSAPGF